jgi:hypothetical protein
MNARFWSRVMVIASAVTCLTQAGIASAGTDPVGSVKPSASAVQPRACYAVAAHFAARYSENQAGWGCATSPEYTYQNGTYQEFSNGEMDWSPSQGGSMVVSGMKYAGGIWYRFGFSDPFNYDSWLLRITHNGVTAPQLECYAGSNSFGGYCTRTSGGVNFALAGPGHYQIIVEGCDVSGTGSHTCRQGWTIPVDLGV